MPKGKNKHENVTHHVDPETEKQKAEESWLDLMSLNKLTLLEQRCGWKSHDL